LIFSLHLPALPSRGKKDNCGGDFMKGADALQELNMGKVKERENILQ
jgi:hypothetical protein